MHKAFLEIRWHGRGGQGAKTAALLFGEAVMSTGRYFQAFPEYGPERMGAPVQAFNRISTDEITLHCAIEEPDVVVVLDATLLETQPIKKGLKKDGILIINTTLKPQVIRKRLNLLATQKVFTVNASFISTKILKKNIPNTPMLGALVKVLKVMKLEDLVKYTEKRLSKKFRKEEVELNLKCIKEAYNQVAGS
jgi:pyruvate ferredoxin oxidoreductase gamma subunit